MLYKKKMNRLNILITLIANYKIEFNVSKNVFFPKPKVSSSVIKLTPSNRFMYDYLKFQNFTRILFQYKNLLASAK